MRAPLKTALVSWAPSINIIIIIIIIIIVAIIIIIIIIISSLLATFAVLSKVAEKVGDKNDLNCVLANVCSLRSS